MRNNGLYQLVERRSAGNHPCYEGGDMVTYVVSCGKGEGPGGVGIIDGWRVSAQGLDLDLASGLRARSRV